MLPRLEQVQVLPDYRLHLTFRDGRAGVVDLSEELWGQMFEPLADPAYFAQAKLDAELGTVVWPNGADFAPEFLYQSVKQTASGNA